MLTVLFASKLATAVAVGAVGLTGATAAAYSGSLPDTAQDVAHKTIKAPAAHPNSQASDKPVGPDATGAAAYGLCTAFNKVKEHGKAKENSIAFRNLATAAGGQDKVAAYCATIPTPSSETSSEPSERATGRPTDKPSHATGKPTSAR